MKKKIKVGSFEWQREMIKPFETKDDLKELERNQYREEKSE